MEEEESELINHRKESGGGSCVSTQVLILPSSLKTGVLFLALG